MLSTHDTIAINNSPCSGWRSVHGYDDAVSTLGMSPLATDTWGPTWGSVRPMSSALIGINAMSTAIATFDLPTGCQSVFLNQICWNDGNSADVYGLKADGSQFWLNTVNCHNPFVASSGTLLSGNQQSCIASGLGSFTQIKNRSAAWCVSHAVSGISCIRPCDFQSSDPVAEYNRRSNQSQ